MNAENTIRELVEANLLDNHDFEGVRFIDQLLPVVAEIGEIKCTLAEGGKLRFQTPSQPPCEVELGRAKTKLRMLCARLSVLCNERGQDVSIYGGEGVVKEIPVPAGSTSGVACCQKLTVRFKNTPSEQEFTLTAE